MGTAAFVLGILSILIGFIWYTWSGIILGIIGIVLGAIAIRNKEGGLAYAGLVLSIIGLALAIFWLF